MKKIAVIITCHNRKAKTLKCLGEVFASQLPAEEYAVEVYLTDDASTDGTAEAVKEAYPQVHIIKGNGSLYWNRGMHLAWKTAAEAGGFDYYMWLNDDTTLMPDGILEMLEGTKFINDKGIVCGAVCSEFTGEFSYGGKKLNGEVVLPNRTFQECAVIEGNCVLISKEVFEKVGIIDPVFPHAIGDHDYGLRVLAKGFKVVTTRKFIGYCENNPKLPKWCYSSTPVRERFKVLYSPLGYAHPKYFFIYENRHFGFVKAMQHYITIHLRALIPSLWK
jgi:GT2 family glycosyltransferase